MLDLGTVTLASFSPHVGTPFVLDHPDPRETFTLTEAEPASFPGGRSGGREPFSLLFDGNSPDVCFDQQILPLRHAVLGALSLFLVPIARHPSGTTRYQAIFN